MIAAFSKMTWQLVPPLLLFLCCSCGTAPVSSTKGAMIYYVGTQEHDRKAAVLKLNPEDADRLLANHISEGGPSERKLQSLNGSHHLFVGDCYHFLMNEKASPA